MIDRGTYLVFVDRALDGMCRIVLDLGDDLANQVPKVPGANSPYVLLTHCLGVMAYWAGELVAGRNVERNRDAEFVASGPVAELAERAKAGRAQFAADIAAATAEAPLVSTPPSSYQGPGLELNQAGALQHVYEELAQHHGQMEIIRDAIVAQGE